MKRYVFSVLVALSCNMYAVGGLDGYLGAFGAVYLRVPEVLFPEIASITDPEKLERKCNQYEKIWEEQDSEGQTLLWHAVENNNSALIKMIQKNDSHWAKRTDWQGNTIFHFCAQTQNQSALKLLLDGGTFTFSGNNKGNTPLHEAAAVGNEAILTLLVNGDTNIEALLQYSFLNKRAQDPLIILLQGGFYKEAQHLLLTLKEKVGKEASHTTWHSLYSLLIEKQQNVSTEIKDVDFTLKDSRASGMFHWIVHWGSVELMTKLVEQFPSEINVPNCYGNTPLHYAIAIGAYDKAQVLFKAGADATQLNWERKSVWDNVLNMPSHSFITHKIFRLFNLQYRRMFQYSNSAEDNWEEIADEMLALNI